MRSELFGLLTLCAAALLLLGCGPGQGDVSGTVKYKNKPVVGASITFFDAYNGTSSSEIKEDGSYTLKKVPAGVAKVAVVVPLVIPMPGVPEPKFMLIPAKYANPEESGLTFTVKTGTQTHHINLD